MAGRGANLRPNRSKPPPPPGLSSRACPSALPLLSRSERMSLTAAMGSLTDQTDGVCPLPSPHAPVPRGAAFPSVRGSLVSPVRPADALPDRGASE